MSGAIVKVIVYFVSTPVNAEVGVATKSLIVFTTKVKVTSEFLYSSILLPEAVEKYAAKVPVGFTVFPLSILVTVKLMETPPAAAEVGNPPEITRREFPVTVQVAALEIVVIESIQVVPLLFSIEISDGKVIVKEDPTEIVLVVTNVKV